MKEELLLVKEMARKGFEKSKELNQMEAAAMFLAQVERILTSQFAMEELMKKLNETDEMPNPEEIYGPEAIAQAPKTETVVKKEPIKPTGDVAMGPDFIAKK